MYYLPTMYYLHALLVYLCSATAQVGTGQRQAARRLLPPPSCYGMRRDGIDRRWHLLRYLLTYPVLHTCRCLVSAAVTCSLAYELVVPPIRVQCMYVSPASRRPTPRRRQLRLIHTLCCVSSCSNGKSSEPIVRFCCASVAGLRH